MSRAAYLRCEAPLRVSLLGVLVLLLGLGASAQQMQGPDFALTILDAQPNPATPGGTLSITFRVDNYGAASEDTVEVTFYLSSSSSVGWGRTYSRPS